MNLISWAKATEIPSLAQMQTSRVLLTIFLPHLPRPQPLAFSSLSLKTPAKSVPPTPGTALQQKNETNLEKSLGNSLNIHLQQQMGSFQASMLEAFQSLREELTAKKQTEVDQTSFLASKPGNPVLLLIWIYPPRDLELTFKPRIWMWTTVQHSLLV